MNIFSLSSSNVLSTRPATEPASWAFVTGATSGIGRDIADELASRGFNIVIHGRRADRLETVSESISSKHACQVRTFCFDAGTSVDSDTSAWKSLDSLKDLNLRVLVNNVGTGHDRAELAPFSTTPTEQIAALLNVNVGFMTRLTHALLPVLRRTASPASPSFIINAGSLADQGLPYYSVYSGTKAYIRAFSNALDTELSAEGADVRVVASIIGDTDSDGHRVGVSLFTPSSMDMARSVLDTAAKSAGGATSPNWGHWLQEWLVRLQPYGLRKLGIIAHFRTLLKEQQGKKEL